MKLANLGELLGKSRMKNKELEEELDVTEKAVSEWVNQKSFPKDGSLRSLFQKSPTLQVKSDTGEFIQMSIIDNHSNPTPSAGVEPITRDSS